MSVSAITFSVEGRRGAFIWGAVAVAAVVAVIVLNLTLPKAYPPYSPQSTARDGTKALVDTLRELGAEVTITARTPKPGQYDTILLDDATSSSGAALESFLDGGGTVLTTKRSQGLAMLYSRGPSGARSENCAVPALAEVRRLSGSVSIGFDAYRPGPNVYCLVDQGGSALIAAVPIGRGTLVAVASPDVLTNQHLAQDDNAVLAAAVLIPHRGAKVAILNPDAGDSGQGASSSHGELDSTSPVPPASYLVVFQGLVVFVAAAFWRGRRLGRPVMEDPAVALPGSELVAAVGRLWHRGRRTAHADHLAVTDARRRAGDLLGLPADAPLEAFSSAAHRHRVPHQLTAAALADEPSGDEKALLNRMASIDDLLARLRGQPAEPTSGSVPTQNDDLPISDHPTDQGANQ